MSTKTKNPFARPNMAERAAEQMAKHFPNYIREPLWDRNKNRGFSTIPRTLPIAMQAIDAQSKGNSAGHTLFCLWARAPDHPLIVIESPAMFAAEAGFTGERASDTWRRRMKLLRDLGFIRNKRGTSGEFHYVLLLNPNVVLAQLDEQNKLQGNLADRFEDRLTEIGAKRDIHEYKQLLAELDEQEGKSPDTPVAQDKQGKRAKGKTPTKGKSAEKDDVQPE
ncbi:MULTISPECIES: hypothetical protein [Stenotrophomonas]|uniref:hypothetical protein n=1 Tax=Stenotrophomonas TaxID=40323 RepID=UPI00234EB56A|nr:MULTISPECIES: hypothetical protein [Stenotrophomonas]MDC7801499.1 hypothetical protein [Stenotrophomonas geniculata]